MKSLNYLLVVLLFVSACKKENEDTPTYSKDYGSGMYIVTENGISFYNKSEWSYIYDSLSHVIDSTQVITQVDQIYRKVNGMEVLNGKKIKFSGTKAYIVTDNQILTANVKTFEGKGSVGGFVNAVDFELVNPDDRMFVVDQGDSKVKVVDLERLEITSEIETGDDTKPVFIIKRSYRSFVMNGGSVADSLKDSTIVAIDYKDELVPLADMMGSLYVGDNPNSAVWINKLGILCKGIYDENNMVNNTESSFSKVDPWNMELDWNIVLTNIYNARNLVSNLSGDEYFFTASDGVYSMSPTGTTVPDRILLIISDVLCYQNEEYSYPLTDSTTAVATRKILYVNDADNKNTIYKYDLESQSYIDTIIVDGNVRDINFY